MSVADLSGYPSLFLSGFASTGKTTAALLRLQAILETNPAGDGESVLILVPQRSLGLPYQTYLLNNQTVNADLVSIQTISGLVRRMIDLFWPLVAGYGMFEHPYEKPAFLTLETSQYHMAQIVEPMLAQGKFSTVRLPLYRLCSQLIDNLNKSALVGFPFTEIGARLSAAWIGDTTRQNVFADVQEAVTKFRRLCLEQTLVDYSLQVELFTKNLWPNRSFQKYLQNQYQHLIYDNCEEDPPYAHDCLIEWLPSFKSALVIFDEEAGFRSFLGADPVSARRLARQTQKTLRFSENFVSSPALLSLENSLLDLPKAAPTDGLIAKTLVFPRERVRFFPDLLNRLCDAVASLVENENAPPAEIAVLSPFISDNLQFSLEDGFARRGLKLSVQKPSMPLAQNAVIKTLITLIKLSHPTWKLDCEFSILASALSLAIDDLDLVRSHLILGGMKAENLTIAALPEADTASGRIPDLVLERYSHLKNWIGDIDEQEPLDNFLSRLFGEILSQPGFGFHNDLQSGTGTARLMESYRKFSQALKNTHSNSEIGRAFIDSLESGLIPAMYLSEWSSTDPEAVLLAPATSFLMRNNPVRYQFWLNVGSKGWYERLEQPLTHPIVLSRNWTAGRQWSADEELDYNRNNLGKVIRGLIARCQEKIYLFTSDYNESGVEERGQLLTLFQSLIRKARQGCDE